MPDTDTTTEIWKPVVGYESLYEVSNFGNVRRTAGWFYGRKRKNHREPTGNLLPVTARAGYKRVTLCNGETHRNFSVHLLVTTAFIGPRPRGFQVDHVNYDTGDNRLSNLRYVTGVDNVLRSHRDGRHDMRGEKGPGAKLTNSDVQSIREALSLGLSARAVAGKFGISSSNVSSIRLGKSWSNLSHGVISPGHSQDQA